MSAPVALKDACAGLFRIGASLGHETVLGASEAAAVRRALVGRHFNTATPENVMKWEPIHPEPDVYTFEKADAFVAFAEQHGLWPVGHTLVWEHQTPKWVFEGATRETLLARMRNHIHTVAGRYRGRIKAWDVVNEAIENNGIIKEASPWHRIIGPDYIEHAFRFAHEADPDAELYYNDYSMEIPAKRETSIALIRRLKAAGLRIDGVGMQGHYRLTQLDVENTERSIVAFAAEGMKVMITELDLSVLPLAINRIGANITDLEEYRGELDAYRDGLPEDVARRQADGYCALFRVFRKHADKIDRVTFWNVTDGDSWLNNWPIKGRTDYPLIFDRAGNPKQAFDAAVDALRGNPL